MTHDRLPPDRHACARQLQAEAEHLREQARAACAHARELRARLENLDDRREQRAGPGEEEPGL